MTAAPPAVKLKQFIPQYWLPVYCTGENPKGGPCQKVLCFGVLREVQPELSVVSTKCSRCGRITYLGPVVL